MANMMFFYNTNDIPSMQDLWHIGKHSGTIIASLCGRDETASFPLEREDFTLPICGLCFDKWRKQQEAEIERLQARIETLMETHDAFRENAEAKVSTLKAEFEDVFTRAGSYLQTIQTLQADEQRTHDAITQAMSAVTDILEDSPEADEIKLILAPIIGDDVPSAPMPLTDTAKLNNVLTFAKYMKQRVHDTTVGADEWLRWHSGDVMMFADEIIEIANGGELPNFADNTKPIRDANGQLAEPTGWVVSGLFAPFKAVNMADGTYLTREYTLSEEFTDGHDFDTHDETVIAMWKYVNNHARVQGDGFPTIPHLTIDEHGEAVVTDDEYTDLLADDVIPADEQTLADSREEVLVADDSTQPIAPLPGYVRVAWGERGHSSGCYSVISEYTMTDNSYYLITTPSGTMHVNVNRCLVVDDSEVGQVAA